MDTSPLTVLVAAFPQEERSNKQETAIRAGAYFFIQRWREIRSVVKHYHVLRILGIFISKKFPINLVNFDNLYFYLL